MNIFENNTHLSENHSPSTSAFLIFVLSLLGFYLVGPAIGTLVSIPFYSGSPINLLHDMSNPSGKPNMKTIIFIVQGMATLVGTILIPTLYLKLVEKKNLNIFFNKRITLLPILLATIIVVTFMGVDSIVIEWNAGIKFPEFMTGFETWARNTEDLAAKMTEYLTTFDNPGQFILAFFVIAIIPAFGEELLFRGFLQNLFHKTSQNIHLAIWISAILFSTIHMQFFGFVPRMLLGALFGYLYYWSGNLIVPIVAHFVNNGFTLVLFYLHDLKLIDTDISNVEGTPLYTVLIFAIITAILLYSFRKYFLKASSSGL